MGRKIRRTKLAHAGPAWDPLSLTSTCGGCGKNAKLQNLFKNPQSQSQTKFFLGLGLLAVECMQAASQFCAVLSL